MIIKIFRLSVAVYILWVGTIFPNVLKSFLILYLLSIGIFFFGIISKKWSEYLILISMLILFYVAITILRNRLAIVCCGTQSFIAMGIIGYNIGAIRPIARDLEHKCEIFLNRVFFFGLISSSIDAESINFTPQEFYLLKNLCMFDYSNKDLGVYMGKSESTIKTQIRSIMDKTGIDTRSRIVECFKANFI